MDWKRGEVVVIADTGRSNVYGVVTKVGSKSIAVKLPYSDNEILFGRHGVSLGGLVMSRMAGDRKKAYYQHASGVFSGLCVEASQTIVVTEKNHEIAMKIIGLINEMKVKKC